jgi:alpha-galactosidase
MNTSEVMPFSFVYGNQKSSQFLDNWTSTHNRENLDESRTRHTRSWTDPATGLVARCETIEYVKYQAAEWIVYFENTGTQDTPILEAVQAIDLPITGGREGEFILHHARGSKSDYGDFGPFTDELKPDSKIHLHSHGWKTSMAGPSGSPSIESLPFFNVEAAGRGAIIALGWTGPWNVDIVREGSAVRVKGGMDAVHLKLHPGEKIRTPRMLAMSWQGDRIDAHNRWRRLLLEYYSPRPGGKGKPFEGILAQAVWGNWMDAEGHIADMDWWKENQLPLECYWMDAGWTDMSKGWAAHQSDRVPCKTLFPNGMRPIAEAAHKRGLKFLLWFVPNSVHPEVELGKQHPEWLGEPFTDKEFGDQVFYGLDHGNPAVNKYMIEYFSKIISDYGIDVFRQDGTHIWPAETDPDRIGINQIRYNDGFYAFWDALLKNNPALLIDNCACGGRKLDLETISRSVVLWRSDCQASGDFDPISSQAFTCGLSFWMPLYGSAIPLSKQFGTYAMRSGYAPSMVMTWPGKPADHRQGMDIDLLRKLMREYLAVRKYFQGDFYPLTQYNLDQHSWLAWQFDRPDLGEGIIQAFRRPECPFDSAQFKLRGLDPNADYQIIDLDTQISQISSGRDLSNPGLHITLPDKPAAALFTYKSLNKSCHPAPGV